MTGIPNRAQVRARNALAALKTFPNLRGRGQGADGDGGDIVSGFPALVRTNGLLAALSFCAAVGQGHENIGNAIAVHLACREVTRLRDVPYTCAGLIQFLARESSEELRLCTAEALAYLDYLKRFAKATERERKSASSGAL